MECNLKPFLYWYYWPCWLPHLMITSSITIQKSMTGLARAPTEPRQVPKVRQKKMMPSVLVPDLYVRALLSSPVAGSLTCLVPACTRTVSPTHNCHHQLTVSKAA